MSIETVTARIADIQARLQALAPEPPPSPAAARPETSVPSAAATLPAAGRPFDVALAQALGQAALKPMAEPAVPGLDALIERHAAHYGIDPAVVRAVVQAESDGNPRCVSPKGAMGLMQLMPATVREYGITDPFDPEQNVAGGVRHLAGYLRRYDGDLRLALAAYNAGPGNVEKYGGVPPFRETQSYLARIERILGRPL